MSADWNAVYAAAGASPSPSPTPQGTDWDAVYAAAGTTKGPSSAPTKPPQPNPRTRTAGLHQERAQSPRQAVRVPSSSVPQVTPPAQPSYAQQHPFLAGKVFTPQAISTGQRVQHALTAVAGNPRTKAAEQALTETGAVSPLAPFAVTQAIEQIPQVKALQARERKAMFDNPVGKAALRATDVLSLGMMQPLTLAGAMLRDLTLNHGQPQATQAYFHGLGQGVKSHKVAGMESALEAANARDYPFAQQPGSLEADLYHATRGVPHTLLGEALRHPNLVNRPLEYAANLGVGNAEALAGSVLGKVGKEALLHTPGAAARLSEIQDQLEGAVHKSGLGGKYYPIRHEARTHVPPGPAAERAAEHAQAAVQGAEAQARRGAMQGQRIAAEAFKGLHSYDEQWMAVHAYQAKAYDAAFNALDDQAKEDVQHYLTLRNTGHPHEAEQLLLGQGDEAKQAAFQDHVQWYQRAHAFDQDMALLDAPTRERVLASVPKIERAVKTLESQTLQPLGITPHIGYFNMRFAWAGKGKETPIFRADRSAMTANALKQEKSFATALEGIRGANQQPVRLPADLLAQDYGDKFSILADQQLAKQLLDQGFMPQMSYRDPLTGAPIVAEAQGPARPGQVVPPVTQGPAAERAMQAARREQAKAAAFARLQQERPSLAAALPAKTNRTPSKWNILQQQMGTRNRGQLKRALEQVATQAERYHGATMRRVNELPHEALDQQLRMLDRIDTMARHYEQRGQPQVAQELRGKVNAWLVARDFEDQAREAELEGNFEQADMLRGQAQSLRDEARLKQAEQRAVTPPPKKPTKGQGMLSPSAVAREMEGLEPGVEGKPIPPAEPKEVIRQGRGRKTKAPVPAEAPVALQQRSEPVTPPPPEPPAQYPRVVDREAMASLENSLREANARYQELEQKKYSRAGITMEERKEQRALERQMRHDTEALNDLKRTPEVPSAPANTQAEAPTETPERSPAVATPPSRQGPTGPTAFAKGQASVGRAVQEKTGQEREHAYNDYAANARQAAEATAPLARFEKQTKQTAARMQQEIDAREPVRAERLQRREMMLRARSLAAELRKGLLRSEEFAPERYEVTQPGYKPLRNVISPELKEGVPTGRMVSEAVAEFFRGMAEDQARDIADAPGAVAPAFRNIVRRSITTNPVYHGFVNIYTNALAGGLSRTQWWSDATQYFLPVKGRAERVEAFRAKHAQSIADLEANGGLYGIGTVGRYALHPTGAPEEMTHVGVAGLRSLPKEAFTQPGKALLEKFGDALADKTTQFTFDDMEMVAAVRLYEKYRKQGMDEAEASLAVRRVLGDYPNVRKDSIEGAINRLMLFYPWLKTRIKMLPRYASPRVFEPASVTFNDQALTGQQPPAQRAAPLNTTVGGRYGVPQMQVDVGTPTSILNDVGDLATGQTYRQRFAGLGNLLLGNADPALKLAAHLLYATQPGAEHLPDYDLAISPTAGGSLGQNLGDLGLSMLQDLMPVENITRAGNLPAPWNALGALSSYGGVRVQAKPGQADEALRYERAILTREVARLQFALSQTTEPMARERLAEQIRSYQAALNAPDMAGLQQALSAPGGTP